MDLKGRGKTAEAYCLVGTAGQALLQCAHECNPMVEDDLFYSISSWHFKKGIKCHFYGYKPALFRSALQHAKISILAITKLGENITQGWCI